MIFDAGYSPSDTRMLEQCHKEVLKINFKDSKKGPRKFEALVASNGFGYYSIDSDATVLESKRGTR